MEQSPLSILQNAAEHTIRSVPVVTPDTTVGEFLADIHGNRYDCASHIVVCKDERFVGIAKIEAILASPPNQCILEITDTSTPYVSEGIDREQAVWKATEHQESALAVVDEHHRFVGLIPPHQLLQVLLQEHHEDLARMGGFLKNTNMARLASEEGLVRRFWHRMPWLILGLIGAVLAADIVSFFEAKLEEKLILAFFIPGIVYLADAVGTQTETLVVRGLSVGVSIRNMIRRELLTGLGIGIALTLIAYPLILWRWQDAEAALAISLSIFATSSVATLVAMALPWLFDRYQVDPAFGSGPLATVIQDLLSIILYFFIATAVLSLQH